MADTGDVDADDRDGSVTEPGQGDEAPPADDSYLLGRAGAEEQMMAEVARAEAELHDPRAEQSSDGADDDAVV